MTRAKKESNLRWYQRRANAGNGDNGAASSAARNTEAEHITAPPSTPIGIFQAHTDSSFDFSDLSWLDSTVDMTQVPQPGDLLPPPDFFTDRSFTALPHTPAANHSDPDIEHLMILLHQVMEQKCYSNGGDASTSFSGDLSILAEAFTHRIPPPSPISKGIQVNNTEPENYAINSPKRVLGMINHSLMAVPHPERTCTPLPNVSIESQVSPHRVLHAAATQSSILRVPSKYWQKSNLSHHSMPGGDNLGSVPAPAYHTSLARPLSQYQNPYAKEQQRSQLPNDGYGYNMILNTAQASIQQNSNDLIKAHPDDSSFMRSRSSQGEQSLASSLFTHTVPSQLNHKYQYLYGLDQMFGGVPPKSQSTEVQGYGQRAPDSSTSSSLMNEQLPSSGSRNVSPVKRDKNTKSQLFEQQEEVARLVLRAHNAKKPKTDTSDSEQTAQYPFSHTAGSANHVPLATVDEVKLARKQILDIVSARKARDRVHYRTEDTRYKDGHLGNINNRDQQYQDNVNGHDDEELYHRYQTKDRDATHHGGSGTPQHQTFPTASPIKKVMSQLSPGRPRASPQPTPFFKQLKASVVYGHAYRPTPMTRTAAVLSSHSLPQVVAHYDLIQQTSTTDKEEKRDTNGTVDYALPNVSLSGSDDDCDTWMKELLHLDEIITAETVENLVSMSREAATIAGEIVALKVGPSYSGTIDPSLIEKLPNLGLDLSLSPTPETSRSPQQAQNDHIKLVRIEPLEENEPAEVRASEHFDVFRNTEKIPEVPSFQNVGTFLETTSPLMRKMAHVLGPVDINGFESIGKRSLEEEELVHNDTDAQDTNDPAYEFMKKHYHHLWPGSIESSRSGSDNDAVL